ncbi:MAG: hypothetical protein R3C17_16910 [Planctomycetaceae bacterium]
MTDTLSYSQRLASNARGAATQLASVAAGRKNAWLQRVADTLRDDATAIVAANTKDMDAGVSSGLNAAMLDRLKLTPERIESLARAVEHIISLPDPVGEVIEGQRRPNGLFVSRVRVPLGVVFFIYESRPNVTIDAAALCVKSGNAVILRGAVKRFTAIKRSGMWWPKHCWQKDFRNMRCNSWSRPIGRSSVTCCQWGT